MKVIFLDKAATTFIAPPDFNPSANAFHLFGAGQGGGGVEPNIQLGFGGTGGSHAMAINLQINPGDPVPYAIGAGGLGGNIASLHGFPGGDTRLGGTSPSDALVLAPGGSSPTPAIGLTTQGGGSVSRGGGGAGGPNGAGINARNGNGSAGDVGFGGAGGTFGNISPNGGAGTEWASTADGSKAGAGGGAGGNGQKLGQGGVGGLYGGGGGTGLANGGGPGGDGGIVVIYDPVI